MKLTHLLPRRFTTQVIRRFGGARLVRHRNGRHELVGGTTADRAAAREWVAFFAHEIAFASAL